MTAMNSSQKLKFRVISCSGEDPEYPVTELLTQSPQSKGWQSPRFCDYPQEITIQFFAAVRVRQVQFLSHQSKIPSKIELYCYLPQMATPLPNTEFKYKKLGYLSLDSNERSGFQARELKSVYIDAPCQYMKFVLHKCHINKYNLFNQVGIIALSIFGELLGSSSGNAAGQVGGTEKPQNHQFEKLEYEMQFDPTTLDRLKTLQAAKDRAVKMEEFEEAKRLKEAIERLKQIGIQLQHLEERKNIAISNEDYDSAKIIKAEIDRLRNAVAPDSLLNPLTNMHGGMGGGPQDLPPVHHSSHRPWSGNQQALPAQQAGRPESKYNRQAEESKLPPPNELHMPEGEPIVQEKPGPRKVQNVERATRKEQIQPFDDQPLPTAQKKDQNDENGGLGGGGRNDEYPEGGGPSGEAEALTGENYKLAEPLIPVLGENCCKKLFSKTWANREEALKFIEKELKGGREIKQDDPGDLFIAVMGAVSHTINDKISQVSLASMQLLASITSRPVPKFGSKTELNSYSDNILGVLSDKIGDNNKRVQENADKAIQGCTKNAAVGCNHVVMTLIRQQTGQKVKAASVKQVCARINTLKDIIGQFGINNSNVPFTPVVEYACKQLENSSEEVRKATISMLVEIYKIVGEGKLRPLLSGVRPAQMEIIQTEFDKASGGGGGRGKNVQDEPETVITTNINTQGANKTKTTTAKSPGQPSTKKTPGGGGAGGGKGGEEEKEPKGPRTRPNADQTKVCEFCGKADKKFLDSDALDLHLWRECPMLTTCQLCAQVVEIAELNHHLLEECDKKKTMKRCPRCKEAVASNEYKQHTEEMSCLVAKPENVSSRCPLCHQDVGPGAMGWKSHLITEGCPNNERTA